MTGDSGHRVLCQTITACPSGFMFCESACKCHSSNTQFYHHFWASMSLEKVYCTIIAMLLMQFTKRKNALIQMRKLVY
jgi:hypothetical protein